MEKMKKEAIEFFDRTKKKIEDHVSKAIQEIDKVIEEKGVVVEKNPEKDLTINFNLSRRDKNFQCDNFEIYSISANGSYTPTLSLEELTALKNCLNKEIERLRINRKGFVTND